MSFKTRHATIERLLACGICQKLVRDCTTIDECCHTFCKKCITGKITEENLRNCPECNIDLGGAPLQRLKHDYRWQSIRNKYVSIKKLAKPKVEDVAREAKNHVDNPPVNQVASELPIVDRKGKGKVYQLPNESVETETEPDVELLSTRRKEKSVSSLVGQIETSNTIAPPTYQKRKYTRKNPILSWGASLSSMSSTQEDENHSQISSNLNPFAASEPLKKQVAYNSQEHGGEPSKEMNDLLKSLDGSVEVVTKSRRRRSSAKKAVASEIKIGESHGIGSASLAASPKKYRKGCPRKQDKNGLAEDLNIPTQIVVDSSSVCGRKNQVWFQLVGCKKQESCGILPSMPPQYLRVQDVNMPARFIKKYLVVKLGLQSEDEKKVEISMRGQHIHPEMRLHQLVEMWIKTLRKPERKKAVTVGSSGKDFVMVFIYSLQL
ncbi:E3 ubiquitin protein ligase DRIP2-like [Coffea arabica]|uniref:E3 ubiquitin protein ligase DRIP2-like n=1 Tax=Coffea arabica TaxID=13443 RepID=A0ABM4X553_COFAR